jgi:methionine synthase II (cobalamin-independent)
MIFPYILSESSEEQHKLQKDLIASSVSILKPLLALLPPDLQIVMHVCRGSGIFFFFKFLL